MCITKPHVDLMRGTLKSVKYILLPLRGKRNRPNFVVNLLQVKDLGYDIGLRIWGLTVELRIWYLNVGLRILDLTVQLRICDLNAALRIWYLNAGLKIWGLNAG